VVTTMSRPKLADIYWDWQAEGRAASTPSIGGVVAVAATSDDGPTNTVVALRDESALYEAFGSSDTPLHRAVRDAFKGQGYGGKGGASGVLAIRQATSAAAKATKTLNNTLPSPALTLTAKFPGERANALRLTVQAGTAGGTNELLVLDGSYVIERYVHTTVDIAGLAATINATSDRLVASAATSGTALTLVSNQALTGGANGATLTGAEWATTIAQLDRVPWAVFAPYGLTDPTIIATLTAWIRDRNSHGVRSFVIFGGAAGETLQTASARTQAINHWDVINLGRGTLHVVSENRDISTAELVARYAGARAWRGEVRDDIYLRFADLEMLDAPSAANQEAALDAGVAILSRDTHAEAPVFIREAVTAYVDDSQSPVDKEGNKTKPVSLYRRIKDVAIQHAIENEVGEWARSGDVLGDMPVDDKTRELVLGRYRIAYTARQDARVLQAGWTVALSDAPVSDDDDFVEAIHGFHPTNSLRQLLNVARIG
jgi:hypothetical protein